MAKAYSKNRWALFLLILVGIVVGSFIGHLCKEISWLKWLDYGITFSIGNSNSNGIVSLDLYTIVIQFGLRIKVTIGSALGVVAAILVFKKI